MTNKKILVIEYNKLGFNFLDWVFLFRAYISTKDNQFGIFIQTKFMRLVVIRILFALYLIRENYKAYNEGVT